MSAWPRGSLTSSRRIASTSPRSAHTPVARARSTRRFPGGRRSRSGTARRPCGNRWSRSSRTARTQPVTQIRTRPRSGRGNALDRLGTVRVSYAGQTDNLAAVASEPVACRPVWRMLRHRAAATISRGSDASRTFTAGRPACGLRRGAPGSRTAGRLGRPRQPGRARRTCFGDRNGGHRRGRGVLDVARGQRVAAHRVLGDGHGAGARLDQLHVRGHPRPPRRDRGRHDDQDVPPHHQRLDVPHLHRGQQRHRSERVRHLRRVHAARCAVHTARSDREHRQPEHRRDLAPREQRRLTAERVHRHPDSPGRALRR